MLTCFKDYVTKRVQMSSGEGDALSGSPQRAQVHWSPLQRQETELYRRVHQGRNSEGNNQENGKLGVLVLTLKMKEWLKWIH